MILVCSTLGRLLTGNFVFRIPRIFRQTIVCRTAISFTIRYIALEIYIDRSSFITILSKRRVPITVHKGVQPSDSGYTKCYDYSFVTPPADRLAHRLVCKICHFPCYEAQLIQNVVGTSITSPALRR